MKLMIASAKRKGQTLLTLVLIIGGIIAAAGTIFVVVAISIASSGYAFRASQTANAAALAGIQDAALQLARNYVFSSSGYTLAVGSNNTTVVVTQNSPSSGYITVLSTAVVSGATRKLSALFSENTTTGQTNLISVQSLP